MTTRTRQAIARQIQREFEEILANELLDSFEAEAVWFCGWLVDGGYTEDGDPIVLECGAIAKAKGAGWACANGHEHRGIEVEWAMDAEREQAERMGFDR
jgi:hypothetical protein